MTLWPLMSLRRLFLLVMILTDGFMRLKETRSWPHLEWDDTWVVTGTSVLTSPFPSKYPDAILKLGVGYMSADKNAVKNP